MPNFSISAKAYAKILLHCCKYPHKAVNGVVIGTFSDKDQGAGVLIQDAVPLFHQNLSLAPMLEVALRQVDVYSEKKGLIIVGYYHANQRLEDNRSVNYSGKHLPSSEYQVFYFILVQVKLPSS
jgi:hypothetical protein